MAPFQTHLLETACRHPGTLPCWLATVIWATCSLPHIAHAQKSTDPTSKAAKQSATDVFFYAPEPPKAGKNWNSVSATRMEGIIRDIDDRSIRFQDGDELQELPSQRVISVEANWRTEEARAAHSLFTGRRFKEAMPAFEKAINGSLPDWQKSILLAEIVDLYATLGDTREAGRFYVKYLSPQFKPPAMQYAYMPACWTTIEPDERLRSEATKWLADPSEAAQLLGASWLLLGSDAQAAKAKLSQLQKSKNSTIAALAVAQGWRLSTPASTMERLDAWLEYRDRLIQPLQLGPTEFIADRLARIEQADLAIGQWSRIATIHVDRYHRSAYARTEILKLLRQLQRDEEAKRLEAWIEQTQAAQ